MLYKRSHTIASHRKVEQRLKPQITSSDVDAVHKYSKYRSGSEACNKKSSACENSGDVAFRTLFFQPLCDRMEIERFADDTDPRNVVGCGVGSPPLTWGIAKRTAPKLISHSRPHTLNQFHLNNVVLFCSQFQNLMKFCC